MKFKVLIVLIIGLMLQMASSQELNFEVSGEAKIVNADTVAARAKAVDQAIYSAVGKALQKFLSDQEIAQKKAILEKEIYSKGIGYVSQLVIILGRPSVLAPNVYTISASISMAPELMEADLVKLGLMPSRENLPRVMVMIQEKNIDYIHWHFQTKTINSAEAIILKALELKGFKLINLNLMLPRLTAEDEKDFYGDDAKKIAQLGKSFGADVVITGKAISRSVVTLELKGDSVSAVAMVTLKAIRTLDGLQLASTSTSASASDISESEAGSLAITNASEEAILNMTSEIMEQWAEGLEPVMDITLYVSGLKSIESLVQFKNEFLNSVPGVKTFEKRTFSGGAAAYDIQSTTDVAKMVADLKEKQLESFEVTVRSYSSNSLDLSVRMK